MVLRNLEVVGRPLEDMEFQIREVEAFRVGGKQSTIHGCLGLDFFMRNFTAMRYEFKTFRFTLEWGS